MPDVLYIIGSGRSGSTVIERVLNSADRVVAVGEVHALWRLPVDTLRCACGATVPDCPFWQRTLDHAGIGAPELARLKELERGIVRNWYLLRHRFAIDRLRADRRVAEFNDLQVRLFDGARRAADADILLDSSKAGPRAWILAAGPSPVFLHAYRGAGDVIASWRRPKFEPSTGSLMNKPPIRAAAIDWIKAEQAARSLSRVTAVRRVSYGDFATAPRSALARALDPVWHGLVDSVDWTSDRSVRAGAAYHSVLGNPDRFDRADIVIRPQRAASSDFSRGEDLVIRAVGRCLEAIWR